MKIAILAYPLDNQKAGVHYYVRGMLNGLHQLSAKHDIILFRHKNEGEYPDFKTVVMPKFVWLPGFTIFILTPILAVWHKVNIVIEPAHFGPFNLPKSIKRVTIIHDLTPLLFPQWHTFRGWFFQRLFLSKILKRSDLIITNSLNTMRDVTSRFPVLESKVQWIYPGIDPLFRPASNDEVLRKYGIQKPYILFVGTIEPRKNLGLLLSSFQKLPEGRNTSFSLVLVGARGWKCKTLFHELSEHPNREMIRLTGYVPREDLPILYSQAHVHVYPSLYEGFGFPPVEAFYCGTPSLVLENSSLEELAQLFDGIKAVHLDDFTDELYRICDSPKPVLDIHHELAWNRYAFSLLAHLEVID